jgi:hypothetical protein
MGIPLPNQAGLTVSKIPQVNYWSPISEVSARDTPTDNHLRFLHLPVLNVICRAILLNEYSRRGTPQWTSGAHGGESSTELVEADIIGLVRNLHPPRANVLESFPNRGPNFISHNANTAFHYNQKATNSVVCTVGLERVASCQDRYPYVRSTKSLFCRDEPVGQDTGTT